MVGGCSCGLKSAIPAWIVWSNAAPSDHGRQNVTMPLVLVPKLSLQRREKLWTATVVGSRAARSTGKRLSGSVCMVLGKGPDKPAEVEVRVEPSNSGEAEPSSSSSSSAFQFASSMVSAVEVDEAGSAQIRLKKMKRRKWERSAYLLAAIASSIGFTTLAAGAVYYRFVWQMQGSGEVPYAEMLGTFSLAIGASVGMEFWARWAHQALWHASLWKMHESHHRPREGPFELNDIFAIINAVPAIALMAYGFFSSGFVPGLCFGAGLGITMFGMAYMFVHDGLVHRRFPVGPIADVPYLQKVAAAHQLHHADLFGGIPYGLFLGPKELKDVGGLDELAKVLKARYKGRKVDK